MPAYNSQDLSNTKGVADFNPQDLVNTSVDNGPPQGAVISFNAAISACGESGGHRERIDTASHTSP
eukprot:3384608-Karenia_brevis.AAC.1